MPGHGPKGRKVKLSVSVHFSGNNYVGAGDADRATITLG
jgi:hypothetical protein